MLLGVGVELPGADLISTRFGREEGRRAEAVGVLRSLATLVAIGIGLHNLGEGLADRLVLRARRAALGTFLIVGFMIHNVTEGLGIAARSPKAGTASRGWRRLR